MPLFASQQSVPGAFQGRQGAFAPDSLLWAVRTVHTFMDLKFSWPTARNSPLLLGAGRPDGARQFHGRSTSPWCACRRLAPDARRGMGPHDRL